MSKTVAVVGRPNVGKSTLFNKIVGKRISITENTPGVTRDRVYSEGEWLGRKFTVIDTGGVDIKKEDEFMKDIVNQVDIALGHADVIVFVVDGTTGITANDEEIAAMLYKSSKEVILAVNKADTKGVRDNIFEFYSLGFGEPYLISAENGNGVGDLLDKIIENLEKVEETDEVEEDRIKVAFIGKPNVGKSSTVNKLIGEDRSIVTNIPGTTRDSINSNLDTEYGKFMIVDTAGMRKRGKIDESIERYSVVRSLASIDNSDVCVAMIDASEGVSEQDSKIVGYAHDEGKSLILAVNKWDLIEKDNSTVKEFENSIRSELPFCQYAPIIFISAETGQRLNELLKLIVEVNNNFNKKIATGVLNDVINNAVLMNQPRADKGRQGKIYYATQVGTQPPSFALYVNDRELIHFSYMRYLENAIRDNFGFKGTPIKIHLRERRED